MPHAPRILFVTLLDCGGSDRIVAAAGRLGAACAVLGPADCYAALSGFAQARFPLPASGPAWWHGLRLAARLADAVREWRPDLVIPLDDFAARVLRDPGVRRRVGPALAGLLARSLGRPAGYATACSRHRLIALARELGLPVPGEEAVTSLASARSAVARLGFPAVLKRDLTSGGFGVAIVADDAELASAFRRARLKAGLKQALRRLPGFGTAPGEDLVLQSHVAGPLAFTTASCWDGIILDAVSLQAERSHPEVTGASTVVRPIERPDLMAATRKLVAALGCSGLVSFDFILAPDGRAVLIEMNPRPTASGHLGRLFGHDIYRALLDRLGGAPPRPAAMAPPAASAPERVALFPRELDRDPESPDLDAPGRVLHDVPWDDPGVLPVYAAALAKRHPDHRALIGRRLAAGLPGTGRVSPGGHGHPGEENRFGDDRREEDPVEQLALAS